MALLVFLGVVFGTAPEGVFEHKTVQECRTAPEREAAREVEVEIPSETIGFTDGQETTGNIESWEAAARLERQAQVTIAYDDRIVPAKYGEEVLDTGYLYTDDLSLLEGAGETGHYYAYCDGKIYCRRYHEDSFEEGGLWGNYAPVPDTEKEIVCIDQEGAATELFKDRGCGDLYLIGKRFYMTECRGLGSDEEYEIYSVDMEGNDRVDYGIGEIKAVDEKRNSLILEIQEGEDGRVSDYRVLDCDSGTCVSLFSFSEEDNPEEQGHWSFEAYQDGWVYVSCLKWEWSDVREGTGKTVLYAVSTEGIWQEVITVTSEETAFIEDIVHLEVLDDRLFFTYGGYHGTMQAYQGGRLVTVKRDGTDYRSVQGPGTNEAYPSDIFYLIRDEGRILVYYPNPCVVKRGDNDYERYEVTVWDIDTGTLYPSAFPAYSVYNKWNGIYINSWEKSVLMLPEHTGRIVKITENLEDCIEVLSDETTGEKRTPHFEHLYYKNGYLYFNVEYRRWSEADSVGWRDGYRRVRTQVYRLKLGEEKAALLYDY